ncbi:MAG: radical SAM protein, partial [Desulfobacterales bacterium]|nr:radical SAM protein [Desulfobacterales bacterium]
NPPQPYATQKELDLFHDLDYERDLHPFHKKWGNVKALETIKFSIATHRGCYGECSFCAITIHQGRTVRWRSPGSILKEAQQLTKHHDFKGNILDVGGPTANMYGFECKKKRSKGSCHDKRCLYPDICPSLMVDHGKYLQLLKKIRSMDGIKNVFIASGLRHDLVLSDKKHSKLFLKEVVNHHVSGQLKLAPEHSEKKILDLMGKPGPESLLAFKDLFYRLTTSAGKKQFLTYYLIAAHPGCRITDMQKLASFAVRDLKIRPKQVQIFTPTPSTYATLMYYTETDPFTGKPLFVEKNFRKKTEQKYCVATP